MNPLSSRTYQASLERVCSGMDLRHLQNRTILISGAAGMLGSCLMDMLCLWNREQTAPCRIVALSRSAETAARRFQPFSAEGSLAMLPQDVCLPLAADLPAADYMIHAASPADPVNMAAYPADTLLANVLGTKNLLDWSGFCMSPPGRCTASRTSRCPISRRSTAAPWICPARAAVTRRASGQRRRCVRAISANTGRTS